MAVAVIKDVKGPIEVFDATCGVLGIDSGGPGTPGCLFEWAHVTDDGFRVISVFGTREQAEANVAAVRKAGVTVLAAQGLPAEALDEAMAVSYQDVHAWYTAGKDAEGVVVDLPVAAIFDAKAPVEAFDGVCAALGMQPGGPGVAASLFEWGHATPEGFRSINVLLDEARAQEDVAVVGQTAGQLMAAQGLPPEAMEGMVSVTLIPVHAYYTAHPVD